jgi:lipoyl(octanoyl) transferase
MNAMEYINLGRTEYMACWKMQEVLFRQRMASEIPDILLLTEHDPVYTIGRTGDENHLLAGDEELRLMGISVVHNDRGGDITYHGPGQLVGYPILDLHGFSLDLHRYLRDLETVIIRMLSSYGVNGERIEGYTGVWVGGEKICAIGIKSSRWITMHGFALNVNLDLAPFDRIIPCGIFERGVTSLQHHAGRAVSLDEVSERIVESFGQVFERTMIGTAAPGMQIIQRTEPAGAE